MTFWITAGLFAVAAAYVLATAILRRHTREQHPAAFDLQVYRDQLAEVDRDLQRGVIATEDAERNRTEISRRILTADAQLRAAQNSENEQKNSLILPIALGMVLVGGGMLGYVQLGAPGYGDQPLQERKINAKLIHDARLSQAEYEKTLTPRATPPLEAEFADLLQQLRVAVSQRPDDLTGQTLLARNEATAGNFTAAYRAQQNVMRLKRDAATTQDYLQLAEFMIIAAHGYISPEAEDALRVVLKRDPQTGLGRYYIGLMLIQAERPDLAFRAWNSLLQDSGPDAPWLNAVMSRMPDLAAYAGVDYTPPTFTSGPSQDDINAASDLSTEEQQEMIRGMVAQLSDRLATDGGTPQEWARLIGAYGVLGETDRAAAIWVNAQEVFAANPQALALIQQAATQAGVAQ